MVSKGKGTKSFFVSLLLIIIMFLSSILLPAPADAAEETKGYLVLVEEEDGTWTKYEDYVEKKSGGILMVKAYSIAKALDITYKKESSKIFTIKNGKKVNTYTKGTASFKYNNGSKTVTKKAANMPYTSKAYSSNMVDYASLWTLVNVKAFRDKKAGDYQDLGYEGVICYSRYHKITELPVLEEGVRVTTEEEFRNAVANTNINNIYMNTDITLENELVYEREEAPVYLHISKGSILTINDYFLAVGGSIVNDGVIIVSGGFERGICELINNGSIIIKNEGTVESGMCNLDNHGNVTIETGGQLFIERGSSFNNFSELINEGSVLINNGGSLSNEEGTIINNGTIDLYSYFNGDISLITGAGSLNDNRE